MEIAKDKMKLNKTDKSMLVTHGLNNVVSVFVSTFLISYIYSISSNYIMNIGLFYCFNYLSMFVFYFIISKFIDKTDRVSFYRVAIVVRGIFILCVVFLGKNLAKYVIFAGLLHGFSEACYWTSYNLMKNELVSKHAISKYSLFQQLVEKFTSIVIPLILGKIIDGESFKICAIIILIMVVIQIGASFFVISKRPENSGFDIRGFSKDVKNLNEKKKLVTWEVIIGSFYGLACIIAPLNTIIIMISFGSNFSLGILTSIFAVIAMVLLIIYKKFTKIGSRSYIYYICAIVPIMATVSMMFVVNKLTVILYVLSYTLSTVLYCYSYDVTRNLLLKKLNMYDNIAEFQCSIECAMELARVVIFGLMAIVGALSAGLDAAKLQALMKVLCGISILFIALMNISVMVYEKSFKRAGITED